ncbi:MAG: metallophosphoesterase [Armatimonadetes bacterium]|nr:metallophosphoesterase [Armatimonadota bacterium]
MSHRCRLPWMAAGALGALGYATAIEPYALRVVHLEMRAPRLPHAFEGYTVCQVSDLHMRQMGRRERALRRLMPTLPPVDLVVLTGDLIHTRRGIVPFLELAGSFAARDGLYAVFGNSEHKNGVRPHAFAERLAAHNITPLLNCHATVTRDGDQIALAGVDDPVSERDDLAAALHGVPDDRFTLLLMHSPDGIAGAVARGVDVVLSGHTHGGQVRLPLFGALLTHTILGRRMSEGYYAGGRLRRAIGIRPGRTQLYVTHGLGVSGLALRFLAPPELTLITLRRGAPGLTRVD